MQGQGHHKGGLVCLCIAAFFLGGRDCHRGAASAGQGCGVSQLRPGRLPAVPSARLARAQLTSTLHSSRREGGRSHTVMPLQSVTGSQPALCGDCPRLLRWQLWVGDTETVCSRLFQVVLSCRSQWLLAPGSPKPKCLWLLGWQCGSLRIC